MNLSRMLVLSLTLAGCVGGDSGKPDTSGDSDTSSAAPTATDIEDLGCGDFSGEVITPTSEASGRIDVLHTDYLQGCCPYPRARSPEPHRRGHDRGQRGGARV